MRRVMRQWLTGVAVLTVREGDEMRGMTCNSFNSVSDNPATVLVSIRHGSRTHDMVMETRRFSLSILPADQQEWADRFAGVNGDLHEKFDDVPHRLGESGAPLIDGALGYFECRVVSTHNTGGSTLFIAELDVAEPGDEESKPLARFHSRYTTVD
jgi:flavin reductase (DIM6/NTAB) family NADH-FMN oxidoreductase RutF